MNSPLPQAPVDPPNHRYGSLQTAAQMLGCTPRTVRRYIAAGDLAAYRLGSRLIRVDLNQVDAMLRPITAAGSGQHAA